jgi:hypothetical protein
LDGGDTQLRQGPAHQLARRTQPKRRRRREEEHERCEHGDAGPILDVTGREGAEEICPALVGAPMVAPA